MNDSESRDYQLTFVDWLGGARAVVSQCKQPPTPRNNLGSTTNSDFLESLQSRSIAVALPGASNHKLYISSNTNTVHTRSKTIMAGTSNFLAKQKKAELSDLAAELGLE